MAKKLMVALALLISATSVTWAQGYQSRGAPYGNAYGYGYQGGGGYGGYGYGYGGDSPGPGSQRSGIEQER